MEERNDDKRDTFLRGQCFSYHHLCVTLRQELPALLPNSPVSAKRAQRLETTQPFQAAFNWKSPTRYISSLPLNGTLRIGRNKHKKSACYFTMSKPILSCVKIQETE